MAHVDTYLQATAFLDFEDPIFSAYCASIPTGLAPVEVAKLLYLKVRDGFLYDPYHLDIRPSGLIASQICIKKRAWCVEKAIVLAAAARKFGIPSRLGFAIVVNHIGVEKLRTYLQKEEIVFHGYVELFLEDRWVKCTPAFDKRICALSKVEPLDWDGKTDSMFQAFENERQFMEYVHFYGEFEDVPVALMNSEMKKHYPQLFEKEFSSKVFSFYHL
jgi:transglutaminase-like putative cysteine protease